MLIVLPLPMETRQKISDTFGKLPITFIPNKGQRDSKVKCYTLGKGFQCLFTTEGVLYTFFAPATSPSLSHTERSSQISQQLTQMEQEQRLKGVTLALRFIGANPQVAMKAHGEESGTVNYLKGNDPAEWITELPQYQEIIYKELWSGIDLVFRGVDGQIKYEFKINPGADLDKVQFTYIGGDRLELDSEGNLNIHTPVGIYIDQKPISFQEINGQRIPVESGFVIKEDFTGQQVIGFEVNVDYDPQFPLIIDPGILLYSTYLGGSGEDRGAGIDIDTAGNAYITGFTTSFDFPFTPGAFDTTFSGTQDAFITKLNATGSARIYSTFLGAAGGSTFGRSIAADAFGNAYVTGFTTSPNFPFTPGAFDTTFNGTQDAFITKLNATGSVLVYSTFLGEVGGNTIGNSIAIDFSGNSYVTGETDTGNFPTTAGAFDTMFNGTRDAFITKLNTTGSALVYSTFLGATGGSTSGHSIAIDNLSNAYVTGVTDATLFPTTLGSFDTTFGGVEDAFVTKLNNTGSALVYSTFLGGSMSDVGEGIAVDISGNAYVTGSTFSTDFPTTPFAFDTLYNGGNSDCFVSKLNATGSTLLYSTYLGGSDSDRGIGIAVDNSENAYVTGETSSADFPVTDNGFDITFNGGEDIFITKINTNASGPTASLSSSTYVGGSGDEAGFAIVIDPLGVTAYVTGRTDSTAFPTTVGAFDQVYNGGISDVFILRIQF